MESIHYQELVCEHDTLEFILSGTECFVTNAIRRAMIADVNIVAFPETRKGENHVPFVTLFMEREMDMSVNRRYELGFIDVIQNTSNMTSEILINRIVALPLHLSVQTFLKCPEKFTFFIDVENKSDLQVIDVTTADIRFFQEDEVKEDADEETLSKEEPEQSIFPGYIYHLPQEVVNMVNTEIPEAQLETSSVQHVLITRLCPGQRIFVKMRPTVSSGFFHAAFSPVTKCFYSNVLDEKQIAEQRDFRKEDPKALQQLELHDKYRYFTRNQAGQANSFHFVAKSVGPMHVKQITLDAISSILSRLVCLKESISLQNIEHESLKSGLIGCYLRVTEIVPSRCIKGMSVYRNFGHTIGNLVQGVLFYECVCNDSDSLAAVAYKKPYPLDPSHEFDFGLDRDASFPHALNPFLEFHFAWHCEEKENFDFVANIRNRIGLVENYVVNIRDCIGTDTLIKK